MYALIKYSKSVAVQMIIDHHSGHIVVEHGCYAKHKEGMSSRCFDAHRVHFISLYSVLHTNIASIIIVLWSYDQMYFENKILLIYKLNVNKNCWKVLNLPDSSNITATDIATWIWIKIVFFYFSGDMAHDPNAEMNQDPHQAQNKVGFI